MHMHTPKIAYTLYILTEESYLLSVTERIKKTWSLIVDKKKKKSTKLTSNKIGLYIF